MAVRLRDVVPQQKSLEWEGNSFPLKGLGLKQLAVLLVTYHGALSSLFSGKEDPDFDTVLATAPQMVEDIIAYGLGVQDEPEDKAAIANMAPGVQLTALMSIWEMTVPDPKALAVVLRPMLATKAKVAAKDPDPNLEISLEPK